MKARRLSTTWNDFLINCSAFFLGGINIINAFFLLGESEKKAPQIFLRIPLLKATLGLKKYCA